MMEWPFLTLDYNRDRITMFLSVITHFKTSAGKQVP